MGGDEPGSGRAAAALPRGPRNRAAAPDERRTSAPTVWLAVVVVSLLWGTAGIATAVALRGGVDPYTLSALRMTTASAVVLAYLAASGRRIRISRHLLGDGVVLALAQVVLPSVLFAWALQLLSTGVASLLYALVPAATALWMCLQHTGSLGPRGTLGLIMSAAGAMFVLLPPAATGDTASLVGGALVVAAVAVTSFAGVYGKRHAGHQLLELTAPEIVIGTVVLLAPGLLRGTMDWTGLSVGTWGVICYLAVGVTIVPAVLLVWLLERTSAMRASLVNYLFPVVAVALGVAWFGEQLSGTLGVGGLVLLAGVAIVEASADGRVPAARQVRPCPDIGGSLPVRG